MGGDLSFEYLKLDARWPGFTTVDLEADTEGNLTLARLPVVLGELQAGDGMASAAPGGPVPLLPAGIATTPDCDCNIYVSDPAAHRIWRYDRCEGSAAVLAYIQGPGSDPGQVDTPRGLAVGKGRLYVADSDNHRIQVIDLESEQPLEVWGQVDPYAQPQPGSGPGNFNTPTALAGDHEGNIYVLDSGNMRVQKLSSRGVVDENFWNDVQAAQEHPVRPVSLAVSGEGDQEAVYILDEAGDGFRVLAFAPSGQPSPSNPEPVVVSGTTGRPVSIAAAGGVIYLGCEGGTVAKLGKDSKFREVQALKGRPVLALASGCGDMELLAGAGGMPLMRLGLDRGYVQRGYFFAGPFKTQALPLGWHRCRLDSEIPAGDAHIQFFTYVCAGQPRPPAPVTSDASFLASPWQAEPRDERDVLLLSQAVRDVLRNGPLDGTSEGDLQTHSIWLGGILQGDGALSPTVRQMRLDYSPASYTRYLPAIYREGPERRLFLELALAAIGSEIGGIEEGIDALRTLFDPGAAPTEWLPWLAGWLDFDLVEKWPEGDKRRHIAEAFDLYSLRGTAQGLKRYLQLYAGVQARIEEPNTSVGLFALDENLALGFNTVLPPAHEQGAVLGTTAVLDGAYLLEGEDTGAPLFTDIANRFCVQVYAAQLDGPGTLDAIKEVVEREKPAHTDYHLCVIEPAMRVGFQARVGIDAIVAGPAPDTHLGEDSVLGETSLLTNRPARSNRAGQGLRVGSALGN